MDATVNAYWAGSSQNSSNGPQVQQQPSLSPNPRIQCNNLGCSSSFSRLSDLARHQRSIHGPKKNCIVLNCKYATGRVDKMKEHVRKKHPQQKVSPIQRHFVQIVQPSMMEDYKPDEAHKSTATATAIASDSSESTSLPAFKYDAAPADEDINPSAFVSPQTPVYYMEGDGLGGLQDADVLVGHVPQLYDMNWCGLDASYGLGSTGGEDPWFGAGNNDFF